MAPRARRELSSFLGCHKIAKQPHQIRRKPENLNKNPLLQRKSTANSHFDQDVPVVDWNRERGIAPLEMPSIVEKKGSALDALAAAAAALQTESVRAEASSSPVSTRSEETDSTNEDSTAEGDPLVDVKKTDVSTSSSIEPASNATTTTISSIATQATTYPPKLYYPGHHPPSEHHPPPYWANPSYPYSHTIPSYYGHDKRSSTPLWQTQQTMGGGTRDGNNSVKIVSPSSNNDNDLSRCNEKAPKIISGPASRNYRRASMGKWSEEEDSTLRQAVKEFGGKNWKKIASRLDGRTDVQVRVFCARTRY